VGGGERESVDRSREGMLVKGPRGETKEKTQGVGEGLGGGGLRKRRTVLEREAKTDVK